MSKFRGFKTIEEHDEYIISKWNSVVRKKECVWILGDVTNETVRHYHLLDRLNGFKKVVGGNHDLPQHTKVMLNHVNSFCGFFNYKGIALSHVPIHESEMSRFRFNIHSHLHEKQIMKPDPFNISKQIVDDRYVCVSCEQVDYTPVLINDIINKRNESNDNN